jgi:NADPH-dependent methylglyoxal reductase
MPSKFLVTGANGFIGLHIVNLALKEGHPVIATVRSRRSADAVASTFPDHAARLSLAVVEDITKPEQFKDAMEGQNVTAIIHTASPFSFDVKDVAKETLDPAIQGAVAVLEAAMRYGGPSLERVVSTSSFASILDPDKGNREGYVYDETDWNPMTYEVAAGKDPVTAYSASKALAEKAQWEWMGKHHPSFGFTSLNPGWVFGPNIKPVPISELGESSAAMWKLLDAKEVPAPDFRVAVDVRDVAAAHILAATSAKAAGERFLLGQTFSWQLAADTARAAMPEIADRVPVEGPQSRTPGYEPKGTKASGALGFAYTPLATTVKDSLTQYLNESSKM